MGTLKSIFRIAVFITFILANNAEDDDELIDILRAHLSKSYDQTPKYRDTADNDVEHLNDILPLKDVTRQFKISIIGIPVRATVFLNHGSTNKIICEPKDNVTLEYQPPYIILNIPVDIKKVSLTYDYSIKALVNHRTGKLYGRLTDGQLSIKVAINLQNSTAELQKIEVHTIGKGELTFESLGIFKMVAGQLERNTLPGVKEAVQTAIESLD